MKKYALSFICACLAIAPFAHAATSALTESLLEYEAITDAIGTNPDFQNVINASEFIVDIRRITKQIDILGQVKYKIVTRSVDENDNESGCHRNRHHHRTKIYVAKLNVAPNPAVGPNIVTVLSIKPAKRSSD